MQYREERRPSKELEEFETDWKGIDPTTDVAQGNKGDNGGEDKEEDISAEAAFALAKHDIKYYMYCGCGKFDNSGCGACGLGCNTKQARAIEEGIGAADAITGFYLLQSTNPCTAMP